MLKISKEEMNEFINSTDKETIQNFFQKYPEMLSFKKEHFKFKSLIKEKLKILNEGTNEE